MLEEIGKINELKWKRPESLDYPKVWYTFKATDIESDELVNYRIEDLSELRTDEAIALLLQYYCRDEPMCEAFELINDPMAVENYVLTFKLVIKQKMALVCFKDGSDEIVGLNMIYVACKDEHFIENIRRQAKSETRRNMAAIFELLNENIDIFQRYEIDTFLSDFGLLVTPKYRGRGIGEHFLRARKEICQEFGIKVTSTIFTSDFSNRIADKAGFKLDKILRFDEVRNNYPALTLPSVRSDAMTIKSIVFQNV